MDTNISVIEGRLGKDPELKFTTGGTASLKFSIACNRMKRQGQEKAETDWFNVTLWGKTAEVMSKMLGKGQRVIVTGRFENRSWVKDDGSKGYATELNARDCQLLDFKDDGGQPRQTHGDQMKNQPKTGGNPMEDNFYDNSGFNPSPVDPNELGF